MLSVDASGNVILVPDVSSGSGSTTYLAAGTNTTVSGTGTLGDPYKVNATTGTQWSTYATTNIINSNAGGVLIGTAPATLPSGYKLYVSNGIYTEKVKVAAIANWADYVFSPGYDLKPLSVVETFIKANKHLPGIPSAESLKNDGGVDVVDMLSRQMEKIEELTLYMIEMKKENELLKKEIEAIKSSLTNTK